ncbi:hypothetical protein NMYAN_230027 [Nitrosomonas nitrosa]|uniref:Uncharacterized protein n=1 Tax=Nitrosomonas nitrosa TaxID=52442 RepID=A0A8H8Z0Y2_9PROT|nr:hypothetical protein NMYAN_230027 [Nitrosomonas nitrosa]
MVCICSPPCYLNGEKLNGAFAVYIFDFSIIESLNNQIIIDNKLSYMTFCYGL